MNVIIKGTRLLYAGDPEEARRYFAGMPNAVIEPLTLTLDGRAQLPESGTSPKDIVILDHAMTGSATCNIIKSIAAKAPELPIILLTEPEDENMQIQAISSGAADCIAKTANYIKRLLPAVEREVRAREIIAEKNALKARGERLRQIVEAIPVGVCLIASDGTFLAINRAGLQNIGAARVDQVIGKNFLQLVPEEEREKTHAFLITVSGWTKASLHLAWKGFDGTAPGIELQAIPLRHDASGAAAALATIHRFDSRSGEQTEKEELRKKFEILKKSLEDYLKRFRELQKNNSLKQTQWETALQEAQAFLRAAEEQNALLKKAAEENAARIASLVEEHQAEKSGWEQSRQSFNEQCKKIEAVAEALRSAQAQLLENQTAEKEQWERQRQELKSKLDAAEARSAELSEAHNAERDKSDRDLQDMRRRYEALEEQRYALETILHEADAKITVQAEAFKAERLQLENSCRELEERCRLAVEQNVIASEELKKAEERITRENELHGAERSDRDATIQDLSDKLR
ncbi:MAG TPA: PAS domain S-box protein, partial [Acidobacteriota bacterium]|nr:PAS domain S-box protein [Acidobacteriota bacterium]